VADGCPCPGARLGRQLVAEAWFIIDELSLYRLAGSAGGMAAQMRQLAAAAAMLNVTLQVLPAIANPGVTSGFVIADQAAYAEHAASGFVYTGETVSARKGAAWRKSSCSGANGGDCAEVAAAPGLVLVRDTKNRAGATLAFNVQAWPAFTAQIRQP
jgi:Domain of unknown function (DUF397)/Domain of unknown function (DUF5753)